MSDDGLPLDESARDAEHAPELSPQETGGFVSDEDIAKSLGPFDPPADFDPGPEFEGDVPRPIPKRLKSGSYTSRRKATVRVLLRVDMLTRG